MTWFETAPFSPLFAILLQSSAIAIDAAMQSIISIDIIVMHINDMSDRIYPWMFYNLLHDLEDIRLRIALMASRPG